MKISKDTFDNIMLVIDTALKCDLPLHRKILVYREALYKIKRIFEGVK